MTNITKTIENKKMECNNEFKETAIKGVLDAMKFIKTVDTPEAKEVLETLRKSVDAIINIKF